MEAQTNSSISLCWEAPASPALNSTYWVRWTGQGDKNETRNTTHTSFTAEGLDPGSSYEFSVWVEAGGLSSSPETLSAATGERLPLFNFLLLFSFFCKDLIYLFLDRGAGRERGRETFMCGCLWSTPNRGPGPQPRHVP